GRADRLSQGRANRPIIAGGATASDGSVGLEHEEPRPEVTTVGRLTAVAVDQKADGRQLVAAAGASVREGGRVVGRWPDGDSVVEPGIEPSQAQTRGTWRGPVEDAVEAEDRLAPVVRHDHPGRLVTVAVERTAEPDEPAELDQLAVLTVERDLIADRRPLALGQAGRVQLVAERAEERDRRAGRERRDPPDLVVGHGRHMGAHRAQWVRERGAPLDRQPLDRVGVVARPGLRCVRQEPRVEATTATGARLEQDLRERRPQPPVEPVEAEAEAVQGP